MRTKLCSWVVCVVILAACNPHALKPPKNTLPKQIQADVLSEAVWNIKPNQWVLMTFNRLPMGDGLSIAADSAARSSANMGYGPYGFLGSLIGIQIVNAIERTPSSDIEQQPIAALYQSYQDKNQFAELFHTNPQYIVIDEAIDVADDYQAVIQPHLIFSNDFEYLRVLNSSHKCMTG
jgi:hypothetical protein